MFSLLNIYYTPSFSYIYIEMSTQLKLFGLVKKKTQGCECRSDQTSGKF
jgi:hypothetical protein